MEIAFVVDRCEPFYHGGYEHHVWELGRRLAQRHQVTIFTSSPRDRVELDGITFERVAPPLSYVRKQGGHSLGQAVIFAACCALRWPTRNHFDFLDVIGVPYGHIPFARLREALEQRRWGVTIVEAWWDYPYLGGLLSRASVMAFRGLLKIALHGKHKVITLSRASKTSLTERYDVPDARIAVTPPGVDLEWIRQVPRLVDDVDITFLGRLDPYKRVGDLLEALRQLKEWHPKIRASIIGEGSQISALRDRARRLGLEEMVTFHGWLPAAEVVSRLKATKIFVMPSEREGFSIATLEAMACGAVPVVAEPAYREVFGTSDFVQDGSSGFWYPAGRPEALADRLELLLSDNGVRVRMADAGTEISKHYDWSATLRAYESQVLQSCS